MKTSEDFMLRYKENAYHNGELKKWKNIADAHVEFGASPIGFFPFLKTKFQWENEGIVQQLYAMELGYC
jgi:hypothetical protein